MVDAEVEAEDDAKVLRCMHCLEEMAGPLDAGVLRPCAHVLCYDCIYDVVQLCQRCPVCSRRVNAVSRAQREVLPADGRRGGGDGDGDGDGGDGDSGGSGGSSAPPEGAEDGPDEGGPAAVLARKREALFCSVCRAAYPLLREAETAKERSAKALGDAVVELRRAAPPVRRTVALPPSSGGAVLTIDYHAGAAGTALRLPCCQQRCIVYGAGADGLMPSAADALLSKVQDVVSVPLRVVRAHGDVRELRGPPARGRAKRGRAPGRDAQSIDSLRRHGSQAKAYEVIFTAPADDAAAAAPSAALLAEDVALLESIPLEEKDLEEENAPEVIAASTTSITVRPTRGAQQRKRSRMEAAAEGEAVANAIGAAFSATLLARRESAERSARAVVLGGLERALRMDGYDRTHRVRGSSANTAGVDVAASAKRIEALLHDGTFDHADNGQRYKERAQELVGALRGVKNFDLRELARKDGLSQQDVCFVPAHQIARRGFTALEPTGKHRMRAAQRPDARPAFTRAFEDEGDGAVDRELERSMLTAADPGAWS